jgi:hypothetical protein
MRPSLLPADCDWTPRPSPARSGPVPGVALYGSTSIKVSPFALKSDLVVGGPSTTPTSVASQTSLLRYCCDGCGCLVERIDIINVTKDCPAPARRREPTRRPTSKLPNHFCQPDRSLPPHPSPQDKPAWVGPSDFGTKEANYLRSAWL